MGLEFHYQILICLFTLKKKANYSLKDKENSVKKKTKKHAFCERMQLPYTKNESFPFTFNSYHVYITQWLRLSRDHSLLLIFFFSSLTPSYVLRTCTDFVFRVLFYLCVPNLQVHVR